MILVLTYIELKNPCIFFSLTNFSRKIIQQLKKSPSTDDAARGIWTKHYTQSLCENEEDIKKNFLSGHHANSMKHSQSLAKALKFKRIQHDKVLPCIEAKKVIWE